MIFGIPKLAFDTPGEASGAASPSAPPPQPPSNPTDPNPDAISSSDEWVLGQFDAMVADEAGEDIDSSPVEPAPLVPGNSALADQVSAQAGKPEGVSNPPSQQTGEIPVVQAAIATPAVGNPASPPPAPVVGASGNQPVVQSAQPANPPLDPTSIMSQLAEGIANQRAGLIKQLAETQYALTEKEADDLGLTPEAAKLWSQRLAAVHVNTTASITQMQAEQLPVYVNGLNQARNEQQRRVDQFFGLFPGLKEAPEAQLAKVFQATTSIHPSLKGVEWMKKAGELAHVSLGIPVQQPQANGNGANPSPAQQVRTPGPIVRQTNGLFHSPVGTSTAPGPSVPQKTEWENFFDLLKRTDSGEFET